MIRSTLSTRIAFPFALLAHLSFVATFVLAQAATSPATAPAPYRPTLMAHGTSNRVWVANIEQHRDSSKIGYKTVIRSQSLPADPWQELPTVFGHAVAITNLQSDLAVLLDDGNWRRVGLDTISSGSAITVGSGPILGWASSGQNLHAVRGVEGGRAALDTADARGAAVSSTRPTTTTTAAIRAARPATPVLFRYDRGQWQAVNDLPPSTLGATLALTVFNGRAVVAARTAPGIIQTWISSDTGWTDWGQAKGQSATGRFSLLSTPTSVGLWTIDQEGGMELMLRSENDPWAPSKGFDVPAGTPPNAQRALAFAGEELRLFLYAANENKLWERRYDLVGNPRGAAVPLPTPRPQQATPLLWIRQSVVLLIMVVVMLVTLYRRRNAQPQQQDDKEDE